MEFLRAKVGDRYVLAMLREHGGVLGGETSGHLLCLDRTTTGDGLIAALQVLAVIVQSGRPASAVCQVFTPMPQLLRNVRFEGGAPLERAEVKRAIKDGEALLNGAGRVLIRKSGTEPVIRVMAEGEDQALVKKVVDNIVDSIQSPAGGRAAE